MTTKAAILIIYCFCSACSVSQIGSYKRTVLTNNDIVYSIEFGNSVINDRRARQASEVLRKCIFVHESTDAPSGTFRQTKTPEFSGRFLIRGKAGKIKKLYFGADKDRIIRGLRYVDGSRVSLDEFKLMAREMETQAGGY